MSRKRLLIVGISAIVVLFFVVCALLRDPEIYPRLKHTWRMTTDTTNIVCLNNDFTYTKTKADSIVGSGVWRFRDGKIIYTENQSIVIDSTIYNVTNNSPQIDYYNQNQLVATSPFNKLTLKQQISSDSLIACDGQTLTILSNGQICNYQAHDQQLKTVKTFDFKLSSIFRGLFGMIILILIAWLFSVNRKGINWKPVVIGFAIQIVLAFSILNIPAVAALFEYVGQVFVQILGFTRAGMEFLLGNLMDTNTFGYVFVFNSLPTIVFFSALTSLLFYLGIIQKVVYALAWLLTKAMKISGAESLSVAGNIFLGQTEAPLMVKAYLDKMNRSEMMLVMSGGMATLAGGVLASYVAFLGGSDPALQLYFAKHLIAASVMAAPGVVALSKIIVPQDSTIDYKLDISKNEIGSNILDAISNGTTQGLKLAANVGAMLLSFIALMAMMNFILAKLGAWTGINTAIHNFDPQYSQLDLKFIFGYAFAPVVWLMGVCQEDITLVGRLLGEKLIMTEFVGYVSLAELKTVGNAAFGAFAEQKSILMSTYALAGFANFASIGIQIGGIGTLAPNNRKMISELGIKSLICGSLASMMSATIVGMVC